MKVLFHLAILATSAVSFSQATKVVRFPAGKSSVTIKSSLKGDQYVDYTFSAGAGQIVAVQLSATNSSTYFNVMSPKNKEALYNASMGDLKVSRKVPIEGTYVVRVYMMRAAGRRGEQTSYTVNLGVTGKAMPAKKGGSDKLLAGTPFHARGSVECSHYLFKDLKSCDGFVIRRGPNAATLELRPKGILRRVLIVNGKLIAWDTMTAATLTHDGDTNILKFGDDETYRFPDALLFGG